MEEKWRHDEASHPASARAERFVARLKRRMIEHERPPSENKHDYPIHNGVIILDSDMDEEEYPQKTAGKISEQDEAAPEEDVEAASKEWVEAASEREIEAAYGEDVEADSEREVEAASGEDVEAASREDVEAASKEVSTECATNPGVDADNWIFHFMILFCR